MTMTKPIAEWEEELYCSDCQTKRPFTVMLTEKGTIGLCDYCDTPKDMDGPDFSVSDDGGGWD